jgi:hypothetical protein
MIEGVEGLDTEVHVLTFKGKREGPLDGEGERVIRDS